MKQNAKKKVQQEIGACLVLNTNKISDTKIVEKVSDSAVFRVLADQTA